jgi:hypothetical protein
MEDYSLWLSFLSNSPSSPKFANIGTVLLRLRKHETNVSKHSKTLKEEIALKLPLLKRYVD